jgi:hypothetical protein
MAQQQADHFNVLGGVGEYAARGLIFDLEAAAGAMPPGTMPHGDCAPYGDGPMRALVDVRGEDVAPYPAPPGTAPQACSCPDPAACSCGAFGPVPHVRACPPAFEARPGSPLERTRRRLEADRAAGVLPGAEPGQGIDVLPYLTDHELGAWTQAILAEHHRRQSRFADYRSGARSVSA